MRWAIVEVMGHRRYAGEIREATLAGAPVLHVEVPELVTESQEIDWRRRSEGGVEERWARTVTRRYPAFGVDLGGGALFAVTHCPEDVAREAVRVSHHALDPEETYGEWAPLAKQLPGPVEDAEVVEDDPRETERSTDHPFEASDSDDECTVCGWDSHHPVHRAHAEEE